MHRFTERKGAKTKEANAKRLNSYPTDVEQNLETSQQIPTAHGETLVVGEENMPPNLGTLQFSTDICPQEMGLVRMI